MLLKREIIKKYIKLLVSIIFVLIFVLYVLNMGIVYPGPINENNIYKIFDEDKNEIILVTKYFVDTGYSNIYISDTSRDNMMSCDGKKMTISTQLVEDAVKKLKQRKYSVLGKKDDTIYFQRWGTMDQGSGFAYSLDGNEPELQFLTSLKPLPADGWYYYEEDYNEWVKDETTNNIPNNILGTWRMNFIKQRETGEIYSAEEIYGTDDVAIIFYDNYTFERIVNGDIHNISSGTFIRSYDNKIRMAYDDGEKHSIFILSDGEFVYYTTDRYGVPIDEYYAKE